ncbi:unnamed protein product [Orchesella dallaii]|uniref:DNA/RNA non-specific endonuclease domain-containing protein n=1 Tax=Orchesella dallaii TaxID=48710 RepID=A0ABP1RTW8_9HEXA
MFSIFVLIVAILIQTSDFTYGASVFSTQTVRNSNDGCDLILPSNLNLAPIVTDQATRQELIPSLEKTDGLWHLRIERDSKIKANCGRGNKLKNHESYYYYLLTCVGGTEFQDDDEEPVILAEAIECTNPLQPRPRVYRNGTCFENATNIEVEFITESSPRKYYSMCMDESTSGALYTTSYIDGEGIASGLVESTGNRPDFRGQEFYPFAIKQSYKWENAFEHLSDLLGSEDLVNEYFPTQQFRFSRGHLFPNGDALKRFERHSTFYYMNTVPQWQNLNGGNWQIAEHDVRVLAEKLRRTLKVTTGAFGVTTLKDANNNDAEIWLARDSTGKLRLPVPRFVWKVVHDPVADSAVAIVQVNNAWVQTNRDILCTDLCNNLAWIRSSGFDTVRKGFTYCCDVAELRKSIPYIPAIKYSGILGAGFVDSPADNESDSGFSENDNSNYDDDSASQNDDESDNESSSSSDDEADEGYSSIWNNPRVNSSSIFTRYTVANS